MQLLISVRNPDEALSAVDGGADIVDAKEPLAGALGPVSLATFKAIVTAVGARRPVSAAAGDIVDERVAEQEARAFAKAGAAFVKVGFYGIHSESRVASLIGCAVRGATAEGARLVAVAYADFAAADALPPDAVLEAAIRSAAHGVLLDTVRKDGPALPDLVSPQRLRAWVQHARSRGLATAVAGRLRGEDLRYAVASGAEIAGVRGAACEGGREGTVSVAKVQRLRAALEVPAHHRSPTILPRAGSVRTVDPRSRVRQRPLT